MARLLADHGLAAHGALTIGHGLTGGPAAPSIAITGASVAENAAVGTDIGILSVSNPLGGTTYAFSITSDPDNKFRLNGDGVTLELDAAVDFETATSHTVDILATSTPAGNNITRSITVSVTNVNEVVAPSDITLSASTIQDDALIGSIIGTLAAPGATAPVTFSIISDPDGKFQIDGTNLELAATVDAGTSTSHSVTVRASNVALGDGGATYDETFEITVTAAPLPSTLSYGWDPTIDLGTVGDIYVDAARPDDSGDGASVATAKKTIQAAVDLASPGDTIKIRGGTYREQVSLLGKSGTALSPIRIEGYGTEKPVISAQAPLTGWAACDASDDAILGAQRSNCFKATISHSAFAAGSPLGLNMYEGNQRIFVATDRQDVTDLFWTTYIQAYHGYPDSAGITFGTDGSGDVETIAHAAVLGQYSAAQLLNALVRYYYQGNSTNLSPITAFNGTDTITISDKQAPHPSGDSFYSLENIGPAIQAGQFCFVDNGPDVTVYIFPATATNAAELDATVTCAALDNVLNIANGDHVHYKGLDCFGAAGDGLSAGSNIGSRSNALTRKTGIKFEHCRSRGSYHADGTGYGFYLGTTDDLVVRNCSIEEHQGSYGFFFHATSDDQANNLRAGFNRVERSNNAPYRQYGQVDAILYHSYGVDCGKDTHANKTNFYLGCDWDVWWGMKLVDCHGYAAIQDASNIWAGFCEFPSYPRNIDGSSTGRAIVDQQQSPTGAPVPNDPITILNCNTLPQTAVNRNSLSIENANVNNTAAYRFHNNWCAGVGTTETLHSTAVTNGATVTESHNVVTGLSSSQTEAALNASDVYEPDLAQVVLNPETNDFTLIAGSPALIIQGRDMTTEINELKTRFPDMVDIFDRDINWNVIDPANLGTGPDQGVAFTFNVPERVVQGVPVAGDGQIDLSWSAPATNGEVITGYLVRRRVSPDGAWSQIAAPVAGATSYTDNTAANGTAYDYAAAAVSESGQGRWSASVTATPVAASNAAFQDNFTSDTTGDYTPRRGNEIITYDAANSRMIVESPVGATSFSGVERAITLTQGTTYRATVIIENISSDLVVVAGEFGIPSNPDAYAEWTTQNATIEDGVWTWVSPNFVASSANSFFQFYFRGNQGDGKQFALHSILIEEI